MGPPPHHHHQSQCTWMSIFRRRRKIVWLTITTRLIFRLVIIVVSVSNTATSAFSTLPTLPSRGQQRQSPLAFLVEEKASVWRPNRKAHATITTARRRCNHATSILFLVSHPSTAFPPTCSIKTTPTSQTRRRRCLIQNKSRRRLHRLHLGGILYDPDHDYDPLVVVTQSIDDDDDDDDMNMKGEMEEQDSKKVSNLAPDNPVTVSAQELFYKVQEQQKQIDQLLNILTERSGASTSLSSPSSSSSVDVVSPLPLHSSSSPSPPALQIGRRSLAHDAHAAAVLPTVGVVPVKAMLFIDGTWLYYSIHEREPHLCPIIQKFGHGWQNRYRIDWSALPRILCESLQDPGWGTSTTMTSPPPAIAEPQHHDAARPARTTGTTTTSGNAAHRRPMEIVRVQVFTSYKSDTLPSTWRYRIYEEMKAANYDVFQKETVGKSEKCVDIQLAVDMLHYATVPNAYDVALILTGDKDFMPAMMRTRQKGRKVALVSMKRGCNKALFETPSIKDYDVIWLEDHLDKWIVPIDGLELSMDGHDQSSLSQVSLFTIAKVIYDFIDKSGLDRVSSRDIGRYLKYLRLGNDEPLLEHVKFMYRGLKQMIHLSGMFYSSDVDNPQAEKDDKSYWVGSKANIKEKLLQEARKTSLSKEEKAFFGQYSTALLKDRRTAYHHTLQLIGGADIMLVGINNQDRKENDSIAATEINTDNFELPKELSKDYSKCTVAQLKERCRERDLPVGGLKADLLDRVQKDVQDEIAKLKVERSARTMTTTATNTMSGGGGAQSQTWLTGFTPPDESASTHLKGLVIEYIKARGGSASSRDVGRYLAANKSSEGNSSALQELKTAYGGLAYFLNWYSDTFGRADCDGADKNNKYAFQITLHAD